MGRIEIPLAQGWARGLTLAFEDAASSAELDLESCFHLKQVHGRDVVEASPRRFADSRAVRGAEPALPVGDGLIAQGDEWKNGGAPLVVKTADCTPLIYVDAKSESVVAIHAGWRGLAAGIHRFPIESRRFDPRSTWVFVGPCLQGESFEVGADLWSQFPKHAANPEIFRARAGQTDRKTFDVIAFLKMEFQAQGIDLVYDVGVDTLTDPAFASYRRARQSGLEKAEARNLSWVGFREPRRLERTP